MQKLLEILAQLGLDQTVWIQLAFFIISFFFLATFLFKPYRRNLSYRKKNTGGALEAASELATVTERLAMDYLGKMKKQNEIAEKVYAEFKNQGLAEEDRLLSKAREQAASLLEETKGKISAEVIKTKEELKTQIPLLSGLIASRLLGRSL